MRLLHGGEYNKLFFCPEDGKVYHQRGNSFNQLQPEWEEKKLASIKNLIANHVYYCDEKIVTNFINDYLTILKANEKDKKEIIKYAKLGCLMKVL